MDELLKLLRDLNARVKAVENETLEDFPKDAACGVELRGNPSELNEVFVEMMTAQADYLRSLRKCDIH